jgi:hypothetical protein
LRFLVELVLKLETGLQKGISGHGLPRKRRKTMLMQHHVRRRAALEIVVANSRGELISTFE